jgi:hypothetical protein
MKPEFSFFVQKIPPLVPVLIQLNPFDTLTPIFLGVISSLLILRQKLRMYTFISPMRATWPAHLTIVDLITPEQYLVKSTNYEDP